MQKLKRQFAFAMILTFAVGFAAGYYQAASDAASAVVSYRCSTDIECLALYGE